ncbi:hypothetical protein BK663_00050 [Pseudomonas lini]|uniref:Uncharacterized protein n=1 Tax=Pseudomonas lini TaxID=163011 RepID=A0A423J4B8_9PSED|nr:MULTISPECIES: hypothetical protein [unclassified Erwinia]RON32550.1 hypothetical protein BK663_00050 [Pseudomonas lini]
MLQFLTQDVEFGDAGFDQVQFVLQQPGNGIGWVGRLPQRSDTAADLTKGKAPPLSRILVSREGLTLEHTPGFSLVAP